MLVKFFKTWCAKTTTEIVFEFYDFCFGVWLSTAFLYKFPLMQLVVRTVRKSLRRRASFIAGNNLHRNEETLRVTEK